MWLPMSFQRYFLILDLEIISKPFILLIHIILSTIVSSLLKIISIFPASLRTYNNFLPLVISRGMDIWDFGNWVVTAPSALCNVFHPFFSFELLCSLSLLNQQLATNSPTSYSLHGLFKFCECFNVEAHQRTHYLFLDDMNHAFSIYIEVHTSHPLFWHN